MGVIEADNLLITGTIDQTIRIWNLHWYGKLEHKFLAEETKHETLTAGKVNEELCLMATADSNGNMALWDYEKSEVFFKKRWERSAHRDAITSIEVLKHRKEIFILTGGVDRNLMLHSDKGLCIGVFSRTNRYRKELNSLIPRMAKFHPGFTSEISKEDLEDEKGHDSNKDKRGANAG